MIIIFSAVSMVISSSFERLREGCITKSGADSLEIVVVLMQHIFRLTYLSRKYESKNSLFLFLYQLHSSNLSKGKIFSIFLYPKKCYAPLRE